MKVELNYEGKRYRQQREISSGKINSPGDAYARHGRTTAAPTGFLFHSRSTVQLRRSLSIISRDDKLSFRSLPGTILKTKTFFFISHPHRFYTFFSGDVTEPAAYVAHHLLLLGVPQRNRRLGCRNSTSSEFSCGQPPEFPVRPVVIQQQHLIATKM